METDVVAALESLGFNRNEGRAYAALARLGRATGYEVGQRSGVPRSAVYTVLRRLVDAGAARSLGGNPEHFLATPPAALLDLLAKRFDSAGRSLRDAIARLDVAPPAPDAFSVKGYERVMEEALRVVAAAERTLVMSGWPRELALLEAELAAAQGRGVYTVIFSHAALPDSLAGVHFSHALPESGLERFWEHRLLVVADDVHTLIGACQRSERDTAVLSEAPAIAEFAVGYVALDITLLAQRHRCDVSDVMARILGDRVGRLDELLAQAPPPSLGVAHGDPPSRVASRGKGARRKR